MHSKPMDLNTDSLRSVQRWTICQYLIHWRSVKRLDNSPAACNCGRDIWLHGVSICRRHQYCRRQL